MVPRTGYWKFRCSECQGSEVYDPDTEEPPVTASGACAFCGSTHWKVYDEEGEIVV